MLRGLLGLVNGQWSTVNGHRGRLMSKSTIQSATVPLSSRAMDTLSFGQGQRKERFTPPPASIPRQVPRARRVPEGLEEPPTAAAR